MIVMLGGPIKAGFSEAGFDARIQRAVRSLADAFRSAGAEIRSAHVEENFRMLPDAQRKLVSRRDLAWLQEADAYVAILPLDDLGRPIPSFGTGVEVGWAMSYGKPVWLLIQPGETRRYSPFLTSLPHAGDVTLAALPVDGVFADLVDAVMLRLAAAC